MIELSLAPVDPNNPPIGHLTIFGFFGPFRFLSNFWPAPVLLDGVLYPSVEHAYQAAKTLNPLEDRPFTRPTAPARPSASDSA